MKVINFRQTDEDADIHPNFDVENRDIDNVVWGEDHLAEDFIWEKAKDVYEDYGNRVDAIHFLLEDWPREDYIGIHLHDNFMGYEVAATKVRDGFSRTFEHELMHMLDNLAWDYLGVSLSDRVGVREWDEDVVHGRNRHFVEYEYDSVIRQVWPTVRKAIRKRRANPNLINRLIVQIRQLERTIRANPELIMPEVDKGKPKLTKWAEAIKEFEGWEPGSLTYRLNNPGALRWSPFMDGKREGFAFFHTYDKGWHALTHQLKIAANGQSNVYDPDMTIREFVDTWAPPSDNNQHNDQYTRYIADKLETDTTTKIKNFV